MVSLALMSFGPSQNQRQLEPFEHRWRARLLRLVANLAPDLHFFC